MTDDEDTKLNIGEEWYTAVKSMMRSIKTANGDKDAEWAAARTRLTRIPAEVRRHMLCRLLISDARDLIRAETVSVEREAERAAASSSWPPFIPDRPPWAAPNEDLFQGKYRHGTFNKKRGACWRGCACDACRHALEVAAELDREEAERRERMWAAASASIDRMIAELKIEWTTELLEAQFAMNDGRLVTWGEATREEHQERLKMFTANAVANLEGGARHKQALSTLDATGATCLNEAVAIKEAV